MICCNTERNTAYCPDCGKKLRERDPAHELLAHLRRRKEQAHNRLADLNSIEGTPQEKLDAAVQTLGRWNRWANFMESVAALSGSVEEALGHDPAVTGPPK